MVVTSLPRTQEDDGGEMSGFWSDKTNVEILSTFWSVGLSAGQISDVLGVSRNAVIGKLTRLGLSPRGIGTPSETLERNLARQREYSARYVARQGAANDAHP